jgi:ABC-type uncharacterized transport system substrate-binding protein
MLYYTVIFLGLNFEVAIFSCFEHASIRAKKKYVTRNLKQKIYDHN